MCINIKGRALLDAMTWDITIKTNSRSKKNNSTCPPDTNQHNENLHILVIAEGTLNYSIIK